MFMPVWATQTYLNTLKTRATVVHVHVSELLIYDFFVSHFMEG